MSERFKLVDRNGIYHILDLHKKGSHILTGEENVDLLNSLNDKNEQLKSERPYPFVEQGLKRAKAEYELGQYRKSLEAFKQSIENFIEQWNQFIKELDQ